LIIEARRKSPRDAFIQSLSWNGKPYTKTWFSHADLAQGAHIVFQMGANANPTFGKGIDATPPGAPLNI
jgi:putative alpha-1,2-mannosidase